MELLNRAALKPSCISIRMTANATPAIATSSRSGSSVSCLHARKWAGRIAPQRAAGERTTLRLKRDVDLQVRERRRRSAVVQRDLHLDDAGVRSGGGVGGENVHLADSLPDEDDRTRQRS